MDASQSLGAPGRAVTAGHVRPRLRVRQRALRPRPAHARVRGVGDDDVSHRSADRQLESVLFTASLSESAADVAPTQVTIAGADPRVADWRFVPDTDSILVLGFDANLLLAASDGAGATSLGTALAIQGIAGTDAIVDRMDNTVVIDLTDGSEAPLVEADADLGLLASVLLVPGGGTLRAYATIDEPVRPVSAALARQPRDAGHRDRRRYSGRVAQRVRHLVVPGSAGLRGTA